MLVMVVRVLDIRMLMGVGMSMDMRVGRLMRGVRMVVRDRGERSRVIAGLACAPIAERMNECAALHPCLLYTSPSPRDS